MSGVSLATADRSEPNQLDKQEKTMIGGVMGSLRVIELQLVAFIMVFSATGLVPLLDLVFPAFASAYILLLSRLAFPSNGRVSSGSQEIFQGSKFFWLYVIVGTRVDTENIISGLSLFSPPVRALVPLLYTVRRIFVILDWIQDVWLNKTLPANAQAKDIAWYWFGRILAAVNLLYFSINLFGFLIPRFLPRAFEKYFHEGDETHWKMAEDKRSAAANKSQSTDKKVD
ncbi:hypothetical protein P3X46_017505 [Hevea brasiliensis]|uniref:DUF7733 domain-containing protein n=1 Tax=Hevea brasiliensis TaxID=3981 RepID=A0ABQ9LRK4_HEVBR|nr:uncharacterized protein LOC110632423 [Hevea brasiliensis]KAJ9169298.1 hypothetical protein P3X46_017505 [Hevea brasiliensis]